VNIPLIIASVILGSYCYQYEDLTVYESCSVTLSCFYILYFIKNIELKVQIIELIGAGACILWLVMPIFFYHHFNEDNLLARTWVNFMPIESDQYYSFVLPGTIALLIGLHFPFRGPKPFSGHIYAEKIKARNQNFTKISTILLLIGGISMLIRGYVPGAMAQVFEVLGNFIFASAFYAYFSDSIHRVLYISITVIIILFISIFSGMFGKLVFVSILASIIMMAVRHTKINFVKKILTVGLGLSLIVILQSVKHEFRKNTWSGYAGYTGYSGSSTTLFFNLIQEKIENPSLIFGDELQLFGLAARLNQGLLISKVLYYIPQQQPYVGSGPITSAIIGGFVPRLLWPDKPESGGRANMLRYTGIKLQKVSMNVAPIGEAYGSFGPFGGIVFMFFLGFFFRWSFNKIMVTANTHPTLLLWVPSIYVLVVVVETDVLTIFNALTKSVLLVWVMYKVFKSVLKIQL